MLEEILEAWRTNNRINLFLLEGLRCTLSKRGGRDVARQFAHLHDVRVYHLEKRAKDLAEGLVVFRSKESPSREAVKDALGASGLAVEALLSDVFSGKPKRRGFKKGIATQLAYFVSHESHHRGSILLTLKESGHKVDQETAYAIWAWDNI
jgi:uncharacterized damage-inducible protein DinB